MLLNTSSTMEDGMECDKAAAAAADDVDLKSRKAAHARDDTIGDDHSSPPAGFPPAKRSRVDDTLFQEEQKQKNSITIPDGEETTTSTSCANPKENTNSKLGGVAQKAQQDGDCGITEYVWA